MSSAGVSPANGNSGGTGGSPVQPGGDARLSTNN
jgi:hypothetical protein